MSGGGHVAQIYAIRQAISKALVSYYQKCKLVVLLYCGIFRISFFQIDEIVKKLKLNFVMIIKKESKHNGLRFTNRLSEIRLIMRVTYAQQNIYVVHK